MKVKLLVDSTCDLPLEYLNANNVELIPLLVTFNEDEYLDLVEVNTTQLYQKVDELKLLPKTASRSIGSFMETYDKIFAEGYDQIIYICISSKFSGTIQNARLAAEDYNGKVLIHDSANLSTGIGLQVIKAVNWVKEGKSGEEVLALLEDLAPRVRAQFAVESLDYLYKGGRCSQTSYFFGKGLKIKPIIKVVDGGMIVYKKPIGKMVNALNKLLEIIKEDVENLDLETVMITHSLAEDSKNYLYEKLQEIVPEKSIMITDAGCVISSHCGKGTIGILYIVK
ncbi:MAG: DegV family protein [Erysipelotrichaceae bacterium]|nr:DegV family protein [Erysipelotrichaceae bacterium]